ncbi:NUDIX domain-containing protein [Spiractinospora alimapuensis]|uniref:NUDIX hydrolase n=1 Tax=Spiractinospora alimapuensis TaxID=2820884 RepID=UPI001F173E1C|nr:NUDIX domain-containing protein [Spiractinospora alimapuensis]QVQ51077.1 NUDIX domain-containing protein [Spiractinospora alimapuensis]
MAILVDTVAWVTLLEGRILGTRSRGKTLFYIPGGKREPGEGDLDTLLREVKEELGVNLRGGTAVHVGTFDAPADGYGSDAVVRMACYTADHDGDPTPQGEIAEMEWLSYADRPRVAPVDQVLFDQLHATGDLG